MSMNAEQLEAWNDLQRAFNALRNVVKDDGSGFDPDQLEEASGSFHDDFVTDACAEITAAAEELAEAVT